MLHENERWRKKRRSRKIGQIIDFRKIDLADIPKDGPNNPIPFVLSNLQRDTFIRDRMVRPIAILKSQPVSDVKHMT